MSVTDRLAELGLVLPGMPAPAGAYRPWTRYADLVFTAGQLPTVDGRLPKTGKLGTDLTTAEGAELARGAALNVLGVVADAVGDLDRVTALKLTVFVASAPDFAEQPQVANGASELIAAVLGDEAGVHARSAVGVAVLPLDSPVEVEAIFSVGHNPPSAAP